VRSGRLQVSDRGHRTVNGRDVQTTGDINDDGKWTHWECSPGATRRASSAAALCAPYRPSSVMIGRGGRGMPGGRRDEAQAEGEGQSLV
jgi:hypothetical protein